MKNVKTLISTSIIAVAVLVACQKQQNGKIITQNVSQIKAEQNAAIKQKTYNIPNDKLLSIIISFKKYPDCS